MTSLKFCSSFLRSDWGDLSLKFCSSIYGATGVTLLKFFVLDYMERLGRSRSNFVLVCMERMG